MYLILLTSGLFEVLVVPLFGRVVVVAAAAAAAAEPVAVGAAAAVAYPRVQSPPRKATPPDEVLVLL